MAVLTCLCTASMHACWILLMLDLHVRRAAPHLEPCAKLVSTCLSTGNAPDGGKPVAQRNNEFDNLLINYDGAVSSYICSIVRQQVAADPICCGFYAERI